MTCTFLLTLLKLPPTVLRKCTNTLFSIAYYNAKKLFKLPPTTIMYMLCDVRMSIATTPTLLCIANCKAYCTCPSMSWCLCTVPEDTIIWRHTLCYYTILPQISLNPWPHWRRFTDRDRSLYSTVRDICKRRKDRAVQGGRKKKGVKALAPWPKLVPRTNVEPAKGPSNVSYPQWLSTRDQHLNPGLPACLLR
jgi:hypothetical protein